MPITKGAKKAVRVSSRKKTFNDRRKNAMKGILKEARGLVTSKNKKEALQKLSEVYKAIDKAAKRGVIKKNTAARKKSRLTVAINKI